MGRKRKNDSLKTEIIITNSKIDPDNAHKCECGIRCFATMSNGKAYPKKKCPSCKLCRMMASGTPMLSRRVRDKVEEQYFNGYCYNSKRSKAGKRNASLNYEQRRKQVHRNDSFYK